MNNRLGKIMNRHKIWEFIKDKYIYVVTFGIACLIMLVAAIINGVVPFGNHSFVVVDGVHQYLPFFSEYQEKLRSLDNMQYSFNVGMGNNFISLWSYYLSSPFNLIILLFAKAFTGCTEPDYFNKDYIRSSMLFLFFNACRKETKEESGNHCVFFILCI